MISQLSQLTRAISRLSSVRSNHIHIDDVASLIKNYVGEDFHSYRRLLVCGNSVVPVLRTAEYSLELGFFCSRKLSFPLESNHRYVLRCLDGRFHLQQSSNNNLDKWHYPHQGIREYYTFRRTNLCTDTSESVMLMFRRPFL